MSEGEMSGGNALHSNKITCRTLVKRPRFLRAGGHCFLGATHGSVRLWVRSKKWSDLLQENTEMFLLDGPSISPLQVEKRSF